MSFFGFDTSGKEASQRRSNNNNNNSGNRKPRGKSYNFQDTYAGLEEEVDQLNDETFGADIGEIGQDFDFSGQAYADPSAGSQDFSQSYSREPSNPIVIDEREILQPNASIWGNEVKESSKSPDAASQQSQGPPPPKKVFSLEELESQMMGQFGGTPQPPAQPPAQPPQPQYPQGFPQQQPFPGQPLFGYPPAPGQFGPPGSFMPFQMPPQPQGVFPQQFVPGQQPYDPAVLPPQPQAQRQPVETAQATEAASAPPEPQHTSPEPQSMDAQPPRNFQDAEPPAAELGQLQLMPRGTPESSPQPQQAQRANNYSRYNGLLTAKDRDFITRVQLAHIVTENPFVDDFYYQVHKAIHGSEAREQEISQEYQSIAQVYASQSIQGFNYGKGHKRVPKPELVMRNMYEQVRKAVSTAKHHARRSSFGKQGALGKISVVSGKTPRRALEIKADANEENGFKNKDSSLRFVEKVYEVVLQLESLDRERPNAGEKSPEELEAWHAEYEKEVEKLTVLLLHSRIASRTGVVSNGVVALLNVNKGKKVFPRVLRFVGRGAQFQILSLLFASLDQLNVVLSGDFNLYNKENISESSDVAKTVELFFQTALPPVVAFITESSPEELLELMAKFLGTTVIDVVRTKIGVSLVNLLISRAEILKQDPLAASALAPWDALFDTLFSKLEGNLASIFPPPDSFDESYVWQFLATLALGSKFQHQTVMVDEVRDRIFGAMAVAKRKREQGDEAGCQFVLGNLNMFLNVLGLNANTDDIKELKADE